VLCYAVPSERERDIFCIEFMILLLGNFDLILQFLKLIGMQLWVCVIGIYIQNAAHMHVFVLACLLVVKTENVIENSR